MATINELAQQLDAVNAEIAQFERGARCEAIERVLVLMGQHGLTPDDLGYGRNRGGGWNAPKFIDRSTGQTWHGVGRRPTWLTDENLASHRLWQDEQ